MGFNPPFPCWFHIQNLNFVIIVPADVLAPNGAQPLVGIMLTASSNFDLSVKYKDFFQVQGFSLYGHGNVLQIIVG